MTQSVAPLRLKDVLHIPGTGPVHDRSRGHYHVVVTFADETDKVLLVPICSAHEKCDKTCLLCADDYRCLNHDSHIMYAKTNFYDHTRVVGKIALGEVELLDPISDAVFEGIRSGVFTSSFCTPLYKKHLKKMMDIEAGLEANP